MATYYVAADGSDSNNGTSASTPWKTLINTYGLAWAPGDSLLLRGGDTFKGMVWVGGKSGTLANPLMIGSYGTGRATITNNDGAGIYVENTNHLVIQDLTIVGMANTSDGITVYNSQTGRTSGLTIRRCEVRAWKKGIAIGSTTESNGTNGVLVEDVDVHSNFMDGLVIYGAVSGSTYSNLNVTVRRVRAWGNTGQSSYTTSHSGNGIIVGCTDVGLVEDCEAWGNGANNGWTGGGPVGIWAERARSVVIRECYAHDNLSNNGKDGGGFDLDIGCVSCTIEQCLAVNNAGAGILLWGSSGSTVRHNVVVNNGRTNPYAEIHLGQDTNATVYGNTVITTPSATRTPHCVWVSDDVTGAKFLNNIFECSTAVALVRIPTGSTTTRGYFLSNMYSSAGAFRVMIGTTTLTSVATWRSTHYQEVASSVNYGLVASSGTTVAGSTVTITPSSPAGGAGYAYANWSINPGPTDFNGIALTTPPPIGALVPVAIVSTSSGWAAFF